MMKSVLVSLISKETYDRVDKKDPEKDQIE
jgi:hypothetical protein